MKPAAAAFSTALIFFSAGHDAARADTFHTAPTGIVQPKATNKDWSVTLGAGALITPEYEGSDEYDFTPLPNFDIKYRDLVTFNPFGGLRLNAFQNESLTLGVGLGADFGRDEDDSDRLRGLGDIDPTAEGQLFAKYRHDRFVSEITFAQDILGEGHEGFEIDAEIGYAAPVSEKLFLSPSIGTTFSSDNYTNSFFGVDNRQAARSGLRQFDADAGFKDVSANLFANYSLGGNWSLGGFGRYAYLIGDAADSPVTETPNQFTLGTFVSYSFD